MQYKSEAEKVVMMNVPPMAVPKSLLLTEDHELQRTRTILLIILGVCLAFAMVGTILTMSSSTSRNGAERGSQIGSSFISILYNVFGIIVAYRYFQTGLRVFAILGVIMLVIMGITGVLLVIGVLAIFSHTVGREIESWRIQISIISLLIMILIYAAVFIFNVIIVKFAFKLARLIDANQRLTSQQI